MAKTKAHTKTPLKTYGQQTARGNTGEKKAASILRKQGYSAQKSPTHPRGWADLKASKTGTEKQIQVKRITSRAFKNRQTARNRLKGAPFNIKTIPKGKEVWLFDANETLWIFRSGQ